MVAAVDLSVVKIKKIFSLKRVDDQDTSITWSRKCLTGWKIVTSTHKFLTWGQQLHLCAWNIAKKQFVLNISENPC